MAINSCYGCVPPKRTPTCKFDGSCDKYATAKAIYEAENADRDRKNRIENGLTSQSISAKVKINKRKK